MDLAKLLAFGDRYLSDNYYFVVEPIPLLLLLGVPTLLPALGARIGGRSGLFAAIGLAVAALGAQFIWLRGPVVAINSETADAFEILGRRLVMIEVCVLMTSSLIAFVWSRRASRQTPRSDLNS